MCRNDYAVIRLDDYEGGFSIVNKDDIKTNRLCETYDNYGNQVGCYDAGCYSFSNSASGMHEDCIDAINEKFNLKLDYESWMANLEEWERYLKNNEIPEDKIADILDFIKEFEKENTQHAEVKAITYWDGHNWHDLILEHAYDGYTDGYILDEEEAADILAAWEKINCNIGHISKVSKSVFTIYKGVGYLFSDDRYPGWQVADCEIIEPSTEVEVKIDNNNVKVTPYWIDNLSFFFEYAGEIYFAEGYISPEGSHLFDICQTNALES